jgi:RNA polymerase sigma factor (sigma-70 family)
MGVGLSPRHSSMEPLVFERAPVAALMEASSAAVPCPSALPPRPSLAELFAEQESGLLRYAIGLTGRRAVAEELVQETFLRLHQVWTEVENPKGWIYRTVRNLSLNHLRDHPKEAELLEDSATQETSLPAEMLGRAEAVGTMRLLLAEMSAEDRDLVRLKYHDGLRYDEISKRTGLSVGNVGYRLHHVLKALADSLRRAGIEGSKG